MAPDDGPAGNDRDDVDDRFAELILAEFGQESADQASAPAPSESARDQPGSRAGSEPASGATLPDDVPEVFSLDEAWDRVELDDPEPYTPEHLPPMTPPSSVVILSLVLLVGGVVAGLVLGWRQQLAGVGAVLVSVSIVVGFALLMAQAVRRRGPEDPDDDGARL